MGNKIDLKGQRFGKLMVIRDSKKRTGTRHGDGHIIWACRCDCGKRTMVISGNLRNGYTRSCGCLKDEQTKVKGKANLKHGDTNSRLYTTWLNFKRKCYNPNTINFDRYGGRGIRICKEWLDKKTGYINFRSWAMANGYMVTLRYYLISRKDRRKHFSPDNCLITSRIE